MRKIDLPPLEALRAFDAAARHLSFTRAAEELFVTQSAVSKQVIALESALATRLFERKTRALLLTREGERLQRATALAFTALREAAAELRGGGEPTITLATTQAFASFWLIPRLADFRRAHPGVDIRISADTRLVDMERGRFDAAVRYLEDGKAPATALRLFGDTVVPVASPAYLRKAGRALAKPADLVHHILLAYDDDEQRRPWLSWPVWLEMAGVADLRPGGSVAFNQYEPAIRAAVDGQGVALATLALVADLLQAGKLVAPLPQRFSNPRAYYLILAAKAAANPALEPFCRWLAAQAAPSAGRRNPVARR
ncbi:MAG: LysR substrate-binding domain-containing protein [Sulfuritalea sp.]|nr:LysR substrate-binding domain-containing protein [Sulfuritalea sp.]MDP1982356.1 LysR substrate-binding domain-containing protein [Sulfuritalea sp.]